METEIKELQKGKYFLYFNLAVLPDEIAWIMEQIKPALNLVIKVTESKEMQILSFESITENQESKLKVGIEILGDSPAVPVSVIVVVLLGVLGIFAIFLTFDKIESVLETPAGKALGIGTLILLILIPIAFIKFKS
jgi:hypothetical protein